MANTNKVSIMHFTVEDQREVVTYPKDSMFIEDGNACFKPLLNWH